MLGLGGGAALKTEPVSPTQRKLADNNPQWNLLAYTASTISQHF